MAHTTHTAGTADVDILLSMMREFYSEGGTPFDPDFAREALRPLLEGGPWGQVWLLWDADDLAGYVVLTLGYSLEFGGRDAFVDELYVRPAYRGRGLGRRALSVVEAACRELGVRALHLEVHRTNPRARALYEAVGFQDRGHFLLTKRLGPTAPPAATS
jgi:ribosomal protein S18 acetylase RimI-like enzyme